VSYSNIALLLLIFAPSAGVLLALPASSSRRALVVALAFGIPLAGPILALLAARIRGGRPMAKPPKREEERPVRIGPDEASSMGALPPILERLLASDPAERLSALVVLSQRADSDAVMLLRWTIEHGSPEAVLDAALTLDELDLRWQQRLEETEKAVREEPSLENAVAAADTNAFGIITGLADPAIAPELASQARKFYRLAAKLGSERPPEVDERFAELELTMGNPQHALELTERLRASFPDREIPEEVIALSNQARFAARQRPGMLGARRSAFARTLPLGK
jgi:hypothetical protein